MNLAMLPGEGRRLMREIGDTGWGITEEFGASALSVEAFADQLDEKPSWVRYWLELAELRQVLAESQV